MKYRLLLAAFLLVNYFTAQELKIMTYNIRLALASDNANAWNERKNEVVSLLSFYRPEAFGVQEALHEQMLYLTQNIPTYKSVGVGRDDGMQKGEYSAIFYDDTKLELIKGGTFWLSPTPLVPSKGWDAALPRICSYGLFKSRVHGKMFWMFNVHFDHIGQVARNESVKLILEKIREFNKQDAPVVLTGDFNLTPETLPIQLLSQSMNDAFEHSNQTPYGPIGTFTGFDTQKIASERIDYIFSKNLRTVSYRTIEDRRSNLLYPSDHFPVLSILEFTK